MYIYIYIYTIKIWAENTHDILDLDCLCKERRGRRAEIQKGLESICNSLSLTKRPETNDKFACVNSGWHKRNIIIVFGN